jgi:hypothetical protein
VLLGRVALELLLGRIALELLLVRVERLALNGLNISLLVTGLRLESGLRVSRLGREGGWEGLVWKLGEGLLVRIVSVRLHRRGLGEACGVGARRCKASGRGIEDLVLVMEGASV